MSDTSYQIDHIRSLLKEGGVAAAISLGYHTKAITDATDHGLSVDGLNVESAIDRFLEVIHFDGMTISIIEKFLPKVFHQLEIFCEKMLFLPKVDTANATYALVLAIIQDWNEEKEE